MDQDTLISKQQAVLEAAKALFSTTGANNPCEASAVAMKRHDALYGAVRELEKMENYYNNAAQPVIETDIDPREAVMDHDEEEQKAMAWEEERRERLYEQYRDVPRPAAISNLLIAGGENMSDKTFTVMLLPKRIQRALVRTGAYRKGGNFSDPHWCAKLSIDYEDRAEPIDLYYDTEAEALRVLGTVQQTIELYEYAKNDLTLHGDCISDTIGAMAWGRKEDA